MGFLPIRDMVSSQFPVSSFQFPVSSSRFPVLWELGTGNWQLPDIAQDFPTDPGLDRFAARHDAARGRQDVGSEAGEHVGHIVAAEIDASSRTADALDARDYALATRAVFQHDTELRLHALALRL